MRLWPWKNRGPSQDALAALREVEMSTAATKALIAEAEMVTLRLREVRESNGFVELIEDMYRK